MRISDWTLRAASFAAYAFLCLSAGMALAHFGLPPRTAADKNAPAPLAEGGTAMLLGKRAAPGFMLIARGRQANLTNRKASQLHRWALPGEAVPGLLALLPGRELLVTVRYPEGPALARLDAQGRVLWRVMAQVTGSGTVAADGSIFLPALEGEQPPFGPFGAGGAAPVLLVLSPEGEMLQRVNLADALAQAGSRPLLFTPQSYMQGMGVMRAASARVLEERMAGVFPPFRAGQVLLALPGLQLLCVIDPAQGRVVWQRKGMWEGLREAQFMPDGTILAVHDGGAERLDPQSGGVPWRLDNRFGRMAQLQPMGGGNLLLSHAESGRAAEITADGQTVWRFNGAFAMLRHVPPEGP